MELSVFISIFLFLLLVLYIKGQKEVKKLPPGPKKLPFIGNLHQLAASRPHVVLAELATKHGPLMHLKLGEYSAIVLSSNEMLKQVLKTNDVVFANRPDTLFAKAMLYDRRDIGWSPYGDYWTQMRKICTIELLSAKRVNSTYPVMEEEILRIFKDLGSGKPIDVKEMFSLITCAITCRASVGKARVTTELISLITEVSTLSGEFLNIAELFPSLQLFLSYITGYRRKIDKVHQKFDRVLEEIVDEHEARMEAAAENDEQDLIDVLLKLNNKEGYQNMPITRKNIKAIILDMFVGGTETAATTLEWAMSELIKNPKMMKKLQNEVRGILKENKMVDPSEIQEMKYLKAVIKETLRLHHPGPLSVPRESREECQIDGYTIPNKTTVLVNLWAIARNSKYWKDAETFDPERFMNIENNEEINSSLTPFGVGKRICPGVTLGTAMVELTLAKFIYHFDWKLPNGMNPEEVDMDEKLCGVLVRKNPLHLIATPCVSP